MPLECNCPPPGWIAKLEKIECHKYPLIEQRKTIEVHPDGKVYYGEELFGIVKKIEDDYAIIKRISTNILIDGMEAYFSFDSNPKIKEVFVKTIKNNET